MLWKPPAGWQPVPDVAEDDRLWLEMAVRGDDGRTDLGAVRILHPAQRVGDGGATAGVRWSELGGLAGRPMPGCGDFAALLGRMEPEFENGFSVAGERFEPPAQGRLDESVGAPLFALAEQVLGVRELGVGVWFGWVGVQGHQQPTRALAGFPGREYLLFRTPTTAAAESVDEWEPQTANLWWDAEAGLLISVDIDDRSTCVRGPARFLDAVGTHLDAEVVPHAL